jgi:pimeloyl-ACP methyl ester carboxylesterase
VAAVYLLDVGAQANNRGPVLGATLRLVPLITRLPGGRSFVRRRFVAGLRQNSARHDWLDAATQRTYTEPALDAIGRVVAMAVRLGRSEEPERLPAVLARVRTPVVLLLGEVRTPAGPSPEELDALTVLGSRLRVERVAGVAHFPHEEAPSDVVRHLLRSRPPVGVRAVPRGSGAPAIRGAHDPL